ncbi:plasma kallikrein-like isoform X1 [Hemicordylus capensis]|uniref:plasma kallikrein-like isoform X1 n=1 Tax=Hemicordylus capensis TaxID=884348 RepID=UPI002302AF77|nr:plasma kallikrein-like isoform X1 [Hemicordylus capensis]
MAWIVQTFYFIVLLSSVHSECVSHVYENTYFQGGDVLMVYTPNVDYCQKVCTYHPRCLLFTYLPGNWMENVKKRFACLLKDTDTQVLPKLSMNGAISGHSLKQCSRITACSKETFNGLDMQGTNYNVTTAGTYQQCQKRCTNEDHCHFFTYTVGSFHSSTLRNKCFLKHSATGTPTQIRQLANVISGFSLKPCQLAETDCQMDIFQHQMFSGTSIASVLTPDTFVCRTICTYHPNCLFFAFYNSKWDVKKQRYVCHMMSSKSGRPDSILERRNAASGYSLLNCRKATPACHLHTFSNVSFLGTELNMEYTDGHEACQQLCTATVRCQFFTYSPNKVSCNSKGQCKCYLRMAANGSPEGIVSENGMVSGYSLRLCQVKDSPVCVQKPRLDTKVVGGTNSSVDEWPWQVSLHVKLSTQRHLCGGSIISDQWILTAAHCIEDLPLPQVWRVYSGILKQSEIREGTPFFSVQEIIVHPNYDFSERGYDIALMKLDRPMNFSDSQQPICLPSNEEKDMGYTNCWVTGWGYTKERGEIEDVLQKLKIPLITNAECQSRYQDQIISNKMRCAGYRQGGKDACKGDSGGPLSCKHQGLWYVVGITSWGEGCARPEQPGVYTNVAEFVDWILEKTS